MTLDNKLGFNPSYVGIRMDLLRYISGTGLKILDVGCATGVNGKYLLAQEIASEVHGIEFDYTMGSIAQESYQEVYMGDLNDKVFLHHIDNLALGYDYILFGDVLEHLIDPNKVVKLLKEKLVKGGKMVISLPNVSHWELLIQLYYNGNFPKNDRGIFDKTHLSWFTKKDAIKLFTNQGLHLVSYKPNYRFRDHYSKKSRIRFGIMKQFFKNLVTFQHILVVQNS